MTLMRVGEEAMFVHVNFPFLPLSLGVLKRRAERVIKGKPVKDVLSDCNVVSGVSEGKWLRR